MKRVKIIANPSSGREEALDIIDQLMDPFSSAGTTVILEFTKKAGDATRFAMEDDGEECIISIGGDGTVNEVVNGMYAAERKVPLAIYPAGTVNDFAESMEIPKDPYEFYDMLCNGRRRAIDIGLCGDHAFINVCAFGLFTDIGYNVDAEAKLSIGRLAYYTEGIRAFRGTDLSKESFKLHVETEDEEFEADALLGMVVNSKSVGGFSKISPEADTEDGKLELIIIEKMNISKVLELFTSMRTGKHIDHDHFIYRKIRSVTLSTEESMQVDIDGERGPFLPQTIEVVPGAIQFITK